MKPVYIIALSPLVLLTSCFKEEPLNSECDITAAVVRTDNPDALFYNASDTSANIMRDYASQDIVFNNVVLNADLTNIAPYFKLTPGAVIMPESGTPRDFSKGGQPYQVTSEDGRWTKVYTVRFAKPQHYYNYDFENYFLNDKGKYYVWSDLPQGETPNWSTANAGFGMARNTAKPEEYPTTPDPNGYEGACVKLTTVSTGPFGKFSKKPIAAGNLFLGTFDLSKALVQTLQSTRFGLPFNKKPLRFTGYYKYKPGEKMQDKNSNIIAGSDSASVYAVMYKNHDADGNSVVLTGEDVMSSPLRVALAKVKDVKYTSQWTPFDIEFNYWEPLDMQLLDGFGYNLAIVCSSSKDGDIYKGAIGSTLWVDKLSIVIEE